MQTATKKLALQDQMREASLSFDYPRAEHSSRELIKLIDEAGSDPWNEWLYVTAKQVLFRELNRNQVLKLSPEVDHLRCSILEHGYSLTGQIYEGERLDQTQEDPVR